MKSTKTRLISMLAGALLLPVGLLCSLPAAAICRKPVPVRELAQAVSNGDAAFAEMDEATFHESRAAASTMLPCLGEALTPSHVAAFHRLQALGAFVERDHAATVASFRSLLAASPGYAIPEDLAPDNHPLRVDFLVAQGTIGAPAAPLPRPREGWLHVDGRAASEAPQDRPYVLQHLDDDGRVLSTALVKPGTAPPVYASRGRSGRAGDRGGLRLNVPLATTAGIAAVASGAFYIAAVSSENSFWDPTTPRSDLQSLRARTNTYGWLSAGAGVVALGTGAGAFIAGSW